MAEDVLHRHYTALSWVENCDPHDFSVEAMASIACLSPYHFSRVFYSMTGMSPALYHRRRVLTKAAQALQKSQERILDIAIEFGYDSHEAFSRAFKKMFHINPKEVKKRGGDIITLSQAPLSIDTLRHFKNDGLTLKPVIKDYPLTYVTGITVTMDFDDLEKANQVWLDYFQEHKKDKDKNYGVCQGTFDGNIPAAQLSYTVGHEAQAGIEIGGEGGSYAVFTHRGALQDISITLNYIWQIWVMRSGVLLRGAPDFELYDTRFNQDNLTGEIEIWIPVVV